MTKRQLRRGLKVRFTPQAKVIPSIIQDHKDYLHQILTITSYSISNFHGYVIMNLQPEQGEEFALLCDYEWLYYLEEKEHD